jgi:hypothetical protein
MRRLLICLVVLALGFAATGCNGNTYAPDNCSLVLAGAVEYGQIPDVGWVLWDASIESFPGLHKARYFCRALTLAYGGQFVNFYIEDYDQVLGGDGTYTPTLASYTTTRWDFPGGAQWCSGQRVPYYIGQTCTDHGL